MPPMAFEIVPKTVDDVDTAIRRVRREGSRPEMDIQIISARGAQHPFSEGHDSPLIPPEAE